MPPVWPGARAAKAVPPLVWAVTALFGCLLAAWSVLVPLYEGPDETTHVDLVVHAARGGSYPAYDGRFVATAIVNDCATYAATLRWCVPADEAARHPAVVRHAGDEAPSKRSGPTFDELGGAVASTRTNQLAQHPPLYYEALGLVLRAERAVTGGTWSLAHEVALLRLVNVVLLAPLPLLTWWTGRRLGLARRPATVASLLPLVVPQLAHIGSTVNNDNLLILLGAVAVALSAGVVRGDRSWTTAVALGVTVGAASLTKSSGLAFAVLAAVAYGAGWWRTTGDERRRRFRTDALRLATVAGVVVAVAGWWYVRNRLDHGSFAPSIDSENIDERLRPPGFEPDPVFWAEQFLAWMTPRFWGWFGWFSVRATFRLLVAAAVVAVVLVVVGLVRPRTGDETGRPGDDGDAVRRSPVGTVARWELGVLLVPGLVLLGLVVTRGWTLHVRSGQLPFLQGRYLFPALTATAVVAACGAGRVFGRWAAPAVAGWALAMHADAVRAVLDGYWGAPGSGPVEQVRAAVAWSRWPGEVLGLGALAAAAAVALLVVTLVSEVRRPAVADPAGTEVDGEPAVSDSGADAGPP